jgi:DNA repair protein RecO (recombination protein O)
MRNFRTEGIIIKRRNYKDQDRILTVLTRTHGKIFVKAVGVRKITSRRAGHIELVNHVSLSLYQGHVFPILTEANTINSFTAIKTDLDQVGLAYHLCELIDNLCPENQENIQVFDLLKLTLQRLDIGIEAKSVVREFEMKLLDILGFRNQTGHDQSFDSDSFIENIIERPLKSRRMFLKLEQ